VTFIFFQFGEHAFVDYMMLKTSDLNSLKLFQNLMSIIYIYGGDPGSKPHLRLPNAIFNYNINLLQGAPPLLSCEMHYILFWRVDIN
jgi:hypothetical protein